MRGRCCFRSGGCGIEKIVVRSLAVAARLMDGGLLPEGGIGSLFGDELSVRAGGFDSAFADDNDLVGEGSHA